MKFISRSALVATFAIVVFGAVSAAPALASSNPLIEKKAATNLVPGGATLHGTVNPTGLTTKYHFEYGTTLSYGSNTPEKSAGAGTTSTEYSETISGLLPNKTYYFRITATNSVGTSEAAAGSFSTKPLEFTPANNQTLRGTGTEFQLTYYGSTVTCKNETTTSGNVNGKYTVDKVAMTLTGCVVTASYKEVGCEDNSAGAAPGEIKFEPLKGQLGTVPNGAGLLLEPEEGGAWASFAASEKDGKICSIETSVNGNLAIEVSPLGVKQTTGEFAAPSAQIKEITLASSGETVKPKLTAFGETATLTGLDKVTYGEATEVT